MATSELGRGLQVVTAGAAVLDAVVFTYLGHLLFGAPLFGAAVGLLTGVGTSLFLPGMVAMDERVAAGGEAAVAGRFGVHRTAAGMALAAAGVVALGAKFAVDPLLALLVGLVVGAASYLPLAWALPGG